MTPRFPRDPIRLAPLGRALLAAADETERAEARLKREIIEAARAGDCARVIDIATRWLERPPVEIASSHLIHDPPAR